MSKQPQFGLMDIPMSCSFFMEPALERHKPYIAPISTFTDEYIHEWNKALLEVMKSPELRPYLGETGRKIINGTLARKQFLAECTGRGKQVPAHSLHYALRFSESVKFLSDKIQAGTTRGFVDLGAGFSPLTAAIQTEYNTSDAYIIDMPEIMAAYIRTAELVGGRVPRAITWQDAKDMAASYKLDTIVAMGVLHYMDISEQVERMKFINLYFPNFLLEIKYNTGKTADSSSFDLSRLQALQLQVNSTKTMETAVIQNSLRYLSRFIHAMPNRRQFIENSRSLFLSR